MNSLQLILILNHFSFFWGHNINLIKLRTWFKFEMILLLALDNLVLKELNWNHRIVYSAKYCFKSSISKLFYYSKQPYYILPLSDSR